VTCGACAWRASTSSTTTSRSATSSACRSRPPPPSSRRRSCSITYLGGEGTTSKHIILLLVIYALAFLMVSNVKFFSFKETRSTTGSRFGAAGRRHHPGQAVHRRTEPILFAGCVGYAMSGPVRWLDLRLLRPDHGGGVPRHPPASAPRTRPWSRSRRSPA
jgi:hypothetical protein